MQKTEHKRKIDEIQTDPDYQFFNAQMNQSPITGNGKTLEYMFSAFADTTYFADVETELKKLFPDCDVKLYPKKFELEDDTEMRVCFFVPDDVLKY